MTVWALFGWWGAMPVACLGALLPGWGGGGSEGMMVIKERVGHVSGKRHRNTNEFGTPLLHSEEKCVNPGQRPCKVSAGNGFAVPHSDRPLSGRGRLFCLFCLLGREIRGAGVSGDLHLVLGIMCGSEEWGWKGTVGHRQALVRRLATAASLPPPQIQCPGPGAGCRRARNRVHTREGESHPRELHPSHHLVRVVRPPFNTQTCKPSHAIRAHRSDGR